MASSSRGAAGEYAAEQVDETALMLNGMSYFLKLGLRHFAENLTADEREYAVTLALANSPRLSTLSIDEGCGVAKLWDHVEGCFIRWTRLCQAHREEVAQNKTSPLLQSKASPGRSLPGSGAWNSRKMKTKSASS